MFDRFDVCAAYFVFACQWHKGQWSAEYRIFGRLCRIGYQPCAHIADGNLLRDEDGNTRYILAQLIRRARKGETIGR